MPDQEACPFTGFCVAINLLQGDAIATLTQLLNQDQRWDYCLTSPPYYGLIDYGHPGQYGLEPGLDRYLGVMAEVFSLVYDGMTERGVLWLNIADTRSNYSAVRGKGKRNHTGTRRKPEPGHRQKELIRVSTRLLDALLKSRPWVHLETIIWNRETDTQPNDGRAHQTHEYIHVLTRHPVARPTPAYRPLLASVITCRPESHPGHPCKMPQPLADRLLGTGTLERATVLDPFVGAGTSASAADRRGYDCIGIDLDTGLAGVATGRVQLALT